MGFKVIINKITEAVIYESADGTEKVYMRQQGGVHRELHNQSATAKSLREKIREDEMWVEIRHAAESNHTIKQALDEVILLYKLSK